MSEVPQLSSENNVEDAALSHSVSGDHAEETEGSFV